MSLILAYVVIGALLALVIPDRPTSGKFVKPTEADFAALLAKKGLVYRPRG